MGPSTFSKGIIDCEDQLTPSAHDKVEVIVNPSPHLDVDTTPFYNGTTCLEKIDPDNRCKPNKPITKGCNICQLNWNAKPADGRYHLYY